MALISSIIQTGSHGSRPAASSSNNGYTYLETDTGRYYRSNGSSWLISAAPVRQIQTLTDGATINWDTSLGDAQVTLGGNRTMAAPTNLIVGPLTLKVIQDSGSPRSITWNAVFKWAAGTAPTLSNGSGKADFLYFWCDGTNLNQVAIALDVR